MAPILGGARRSASEKPAAGIGRREEAMTENGTEEMRTSANIEFDAARHDALEVLHNLGTRLEKLSVLSTIYLRNNTTQRGNAHRTFHS